MLHKYVITPDSIIKAENLNFRKMPTRNDPILGLQWSVGSVHNLVHKKMELKSVCILGTSIDM
jgi:hypothetical protein